MSEHVKSIVGLTRAEYTNNLESWRRNEKRFTAGDDVYDELRPFQWESAIKAVDNESGSVTANPDLGSYKARQASAVCVEFAAMTREKFGGLLFQHFPQEGKGLDLGTLRSRDNGWRADALLKNADGTGDAARSLESFWRDEMELAMSTRFRWIMAEAPAGGASSLAEEEGNRPYLVGFSPVSVPYWHFERGNLQCIRIVLEDSAPALGEDGKVSHAVRKRHYLMTREGFAGWGDSEGFEFSSGGWWIVDDEGNQVVVDEKPMRGDWSSTGGEIPVAPLFYERGEIGNRDTGITHIGRIQTEFMNQLSAMFYSSWVSGSGVVFFAGADNEQWDAMRHAGMFGGQWIPIPPKTTDTGGAASNVSIQALSAFDASPGIKTSLEWLLKLATQLVIRELTTSPDASGAARQLEFVQGNSPRLSNMGANAQDCMTTIHRYLELRWGASEPTGSVKWTKRFDLRTAIEKMRGVLELMAEASASSPTVVSELLVSALRSEGFIPDESDDKEVAETVKQEVVESLTPAARREDLFGALGLGNAA